MKDIRKWIDPLAYARNYAASEAKFRHYPDQANELMDVSLLYDGKNTRQASLLLMGAKDPANGGEWKAMPILRFYDGSPEMPLQNFFSKEKFGKLLERLSIWIEEYKALLAEIRSER